MAADAAEASSLLLPVDVSDETDVVTVGMFDVDTTVTHFDLSASAAAGAAESLESALSSASAHCLSTRLS